MSRDTQFQGFAKALWDEIVQMGIDGPKDEDIDISYQRLIARRAYDLALHVIDNSRANYLEDAYTHEIMPVIPDMPELPKEQEEDPDWAKKLAKGIYEKLDSEGLLTGLVDEEKEAIQQRINERQNMSGSQFDQEYFGKFVE